MSEAHDPNVDRLEGLLTRLEDERARLEAVGDADEAVAILGRLAELAREVQAEIDRVRREADDALA